MPFWSPDSRTLGFFAGGTLKTIDASGGPVRTLCDAPSARGGTWSPDGAIVFGSQSGGLSTVSGSGGSPTPVTTPDTAHEETAHRFPSFLPDGRHFVYWTTPPNTIMLGSLDSKETRPLFTAESQAVYVGPGSLLFVRRGTLMSQPFDARRGTLMGEAVPIAEEVLADTIGAAAFAASSSGVLAYRVGTLGGQTQLSWVDRAGRQLGAVGPPGRYRNPDLSPDGARVAVEVVDPQGRTQDIWVVEVTRGVASRVTLDPGNDVYPVWSPDGRQIMFGSDRSGVFSLYQKRADGAGDEKLVLKSKTDMVPYSWSPDGRVVVYRTTAVNGGTNLGLLSLQEERPPQLFEPSRFNQGTSQVSPDGRWLAYVSGESGRNEIYVQSFPAPGRGKVQISREGSSFVRWRRDSRELLYYASDGRLMAVPLLNATTLEVGLASPLFEPHTLNGPSPTFGFRQQYDVAPDGRFLLNLPMGDATPETITVVVNWQTALKK
jgi:Tol biopolymer transport system component